MPFQRRSRSGWLCRSAVAILLSLGLGQSVASAGPIAESFEGQAASWTVATDVAGGGTATRDTTLAAGGQASVRLTSGGSGDRAQVRGDFADSALDHIWEERPGTWFWQRTSVYVPSSTLTRLHEGEFVTIAGLWPSVPNNYGWFLRVRAGGALSVVGSRDWDNTQFEFPVYGTIPTDRWFQLELGLHTQAGPGVKRAFGFLVDGDFYGWFHQGRMLDETYNRAAVGLIETNATGLSGPLEVLVDEWATPGTTDVPTGPDNRSTAALQSQDYRDRSGVQWQIDWTTWENELTLDPRFGLYSSFRVQAGRNTDRMPNLTDGWAEIEVDWPNGTPPAPDEYFGPMVGFRKEINREENLEVVPIANPDGSVDLAFEAWAGGGPVIFDRWPMPRDENGRAIPSPGDILRARWQERTPGVIEVRASYYVAATSTWYQDILAGEYTLTNVNGVDFSDGFHTAFTVTIDSPYYSIRRYTVGTIDTYPGSGTCALAVTPATASFGSGGGSGALTVETAPACTWTASSDQPWVSPIAPLTGSGSGTLSYSVAPNPVGTSRVASLHVGDQSVQISQGPAPCSFSVSPPAQSVGSGAGTATLTVTATAGCDWTALPTVAWITIGTGGTGTGDGAVSLSIAANPGSARVGTVTVAGQTATISQAAAATPVVSIAGVTVAEGNAGTTPATFTVSLSTASAQTVTVGYATANGTATAGSDYTAAAGTLTFAPGVTTQPLTVSILGDTLFEAAETFVVTLSAPANATLGTAQATATITNDDAAPVVSIAGVTANEGNTGTTSFTFTVTLSAASGLPTTVAYATSDGTATAGSDYTAATGTLTFAPGVTSQPLTVSVLGDTLFEATETFTVTLSAATNATLGTAQATGTITNDDVAPPTPVVSIAGVTVVEGNAGTTPATFTVSLSTASAQTVTVAYATANGTATAGSDYTAAAGTLTFAPGVTSQPLTVSVLGDTLVEATETFVVTLSAPTSATLGAAQATGTIANDDVATGPTSATFQIAASEDDVNEDGAAFDTASASVWLGTGSSATSSYAGLRFTGVTIPAGATITSAHLEVNAAATQWNALSWEYALEASDNSAPFTDLSRPSQRALLAPRVTHSSDAQWLASTWYALDDIAPLVQALVNQGSWAPGNAASLVLHGLGSSWARKFARAFDDVPATAPRLVVTYTSAGAAQPLISITDATVAEGNAGTTPATFTVRLSTASAQTVTVAYTTANGTATAGSDYTAATGTLTFAPGVTSQPVTVSVQGDTLFEATETFVVTLSAPTNATLGTVQATGTITNDDVAPPTPVVSIAGVTVAEGNAGTTPATFTVSLSTASAQTVTVAYATANGTATAGSDYTAATGTLTFAPGVTSQPVTVSVLGDTLFEATETFTVTLSAPTNATLGTAQATGTITNDDVSTGPTTATFQIAASEDDVNEDGAAFDSAGSDLWVGNGSVATASFLGLHFVGVSIPAGATVTSAHIELNAGATQWIPLSLEVAAGASANAAPFSLINRPSQLPLLPVRIPSESDQQWVSGTWYALDDIAAIIQSVVGQSGWSAGNAVNVIVKGAGDAWSRKFIQSFDASPADAPRLVVTYTR